jgi:NAD+ diphosphatase
MHTPKGFVPGYALPDPLPPAALAFAFHEGRLLVRDAGGPEAAAPEVPAWRDLTELGLAGATHFLGTLDGVPSVAVGIAQDPPLPAGWRFAGLRSLFFALPEPVLATAARASQIVEWDRTHRFCGVCGTATRDKPGDRAKECPACGHAAFPRVSPAMMVLVTRGRDVLLARANRFPVAMYSALAGFVEPGETIEDCIHREVREEVGIAVERLAYFGSQSWSFPHSLMIAFTAEYAGGDLTPDGTEIADAQWFAPESVPKLPPSVSIARRLIDTTVARLASMPVRPC